MARALGGLATPCGQVERRRREHELVAAVGGAVGGEGVEEEHLAERQPEHRQQHACARTPRGRVACRRVASAATSGSRCEPRGQISTPGLSQPIAAMCRFHSVRHVLLARMQPGATGTSPTVAEPGPLVGVGWRQVPARSIRSARAARRPRRPRCPDRRGTRASRRASMASGSSYRMRPPVRLAPAADVGQHAASRRCRAAPSGRCRARSSSTPPKWPVPGSSSRTAWLRMWRKPSHWLDDCVFQSVEHVVVARCLVAGDRVV